MKLVKLEKKEKNKKYSALRRLVRSLSFDKLTECRATICQKATPKSGQKTIHCPRQCPKLQINHFGSQLMRTLKFNNLLLNLNASRGINLGAGIL